MSTIININTKGYENQSHREFPENWNGENWLPVPPHLEHIVLEHAPYVNLHINENELTDVEILERPAETIELSPIEMRLTELEAKTLYIGMLTETL